MSSDGLRSVAAIGRPPWRVPAAPGAGVARALSLVARAARRVPPTPAAGAGKASPPAAGGAWRLGAWFGGSRLPGVVVRWRCHRRLPPMLGDEARTGWVSGLGDWKCGGGLDGNRGPEPGGRPPGSGFFGCAAGVGEAVVQRTVAVGTWQWVLASGSAEGLCGGGSRRLVGSVPAGRVQGVGLGAWFVGFRGGRFDAVRWVGSVRVLDVGMPWGKRGWVRPGSVFHASSTLDHRPWPTDHPPPNPASLGPGGSESAGQPPPSGHPEPDPASPAPDPSSRVVRPGPARPM
ncbi:MAG: hypothetical protein QOF98_1075 [Streptomyces sp.]|nr:hypothetical protein [Streptomyces sp.]